MITNHKHYFSMARAVELQDEAKTLEAEELRKTTKVIVEVRKTRKYDRKGVVQRLLTNAAKRVVAYSQELAIDDASVFVELGDYESAYRVLKRNGLDDEAEALKKAIKGGD